MHAILHPAHHVRNRLSNTGTMWGIDTNTESMVHPRLRDIQKYGDLRLWEGRPATERDMSLLSFKTPWAWPPQGDLEPSCLSGNDCVKCSTIYIDILGKEKPLHRRTLHEH